MTENAMTLEEAIKHLDDVLESDRKWECEECRSEHIQLRGFLKELEKYRLIGTVTECREAMEKQRAKKPVKDEYDHECCPSCG